jgi:uncharacterized membrane protein YdcZ (DUF606 family)
MNIKFLGIALVIIGIIMMVYTGFNFVTEETVVDIGNLQIDKKENHPVRWSPYVGIVLLIVGALMFFIGKRK